MSKSFRHKTESELQLFEGHRKGFWKQFKHGRQIIWIQLIYPITSSVMNKQDTQLLVHNKLLTI